MTDDHVRVRPVRTLLDRHRFVDLPFRLFGHDPNWVPPLRMSVYDRISPRHPTAAHQETQLWLALRGGRPVGRIGACIDRLYNDFQQESRAWIGFFESIDDQTVAEALFDQAWRWSAERGARQALGPASFTTNDDSGLLVDGFDDPVMALTPGNPRYYERLWTRGSWRPAQDLLAWRMDLGTRLSDRQNRAVEIVQRRSNVRVRAMRRKDFDAEVDRFFEVYNAAWERNWGFAPATEAEIRHLGQAMKYVVDPDLALVAETPEGRPVAITMVLPDFNEALRKERSGRLFPTGWWRLLNASRTCTRVRIFALGERKEYEASGVGLLLYRELYNRLYARPRIQEAEASWILESNHDMNDVLKAVGATVSRRWRMYTRLLCSTAERGTEGRR